MRAEIGRSRPSRAGVLVAVAIAVAVSLGVVSCGGDDADDATESTPAIESAPTTEPAHQPGDDADVELEREDTAVSFARDVQPVVTATCARCHTGDGPGTPHLLLETAADVAAHAFAIATNVELQIMPPWPASDHSIAFRDDLSLTPEQIAAIKAWQQAGAPLDVDPAMAIEPDTEVFRLSDPDLEMVPATGGYRGVAGQPDQYRCLIYDPGLTAERHLEAFEFIPDQTEVVHHAIGYLVPANLRDRATARDGEDGQPGWTCYGSSGLGEEDIFLGWAPGQGPTELPEGSGMPLAKGDFLVVQVHYHFEQDAPADLSSLRLRWSDDPEPDDVVLTDFLAPAEIPCSSDEIGPLCDREAALAKAIETYGQEGVLADRILGLCGFSPTDYAEMTDGIASAQCDLPTREFGKIVSVLGHEHELGKTFRMTLNPDTPDEVVLLDIDRWDFDWQYNYYPFDHIVLKPGDWVRLECSWDRSLREADLEPSYVLWADGTNDEMCFGTIVVRELS
jgi:hypothetical protein